MAITIIKKNGLKVTQNIPWNDDWANWVRLSAYSIAEIHADGHEFDYLKRRFMYLPAPSNHAVWAGDWAMLVALNFPDYIKKSESFEELWQELSKSGSLTIKTLKQKIQDLPDDMKVASAGHYGELLECFDAEVTDVFKNNATTEKELVFRMYFESAGENPDEL